METLSKTASNKLRDRYRRLNDDIAQAAENENRKPHSIASLIVSDDAVPEQIRQLVELGHRDFGESSINNLPQRALQLREFLGRKRFLARFRAADNNADDPTNQPVRWHMLGPIPRNKLKPISSLVNMVHSIDNLRIAEDLHLFIGRLEAVQHNSADAPQIDVLLQVNTTGDNSRRGVAPPAAIHLAEQIDSMINLRLRGLCATPLTPDDDDATRDRAFARCAELFEDISDAHIAGNHFTIMAMGNQSNFPRAIEFGANFLRIGTSLFHDE